MQGRVLCFAHLSSLSSAYLWTDSSSSQLKVPRLGNGHITLWTPRNAVVEPSTPIVLLLHGVYGSHWAWALKGGVHLTAQRLISADAIPAMVICMPSDGLWGDGSGYVSHRAHDFEHWIVEEAPAAALMAHGRFGARPLLFVAGLSMGGF